MFSRPDELSDGQLLRAVAEAWRVDLRSVEYRAVGFGSHHWYAVDAHGGRWFITVDQVDVGDRNGGKSSEDYRWLNSALLTARAAHDYDGGFVLAPTRRPDSELLLRLNDQFVASLYPFVEGASGSFANILSEADRLEVLSLLSGWLDAYDHYVVDMKANAAPLVLTHGEPHPGNLIGSSTGWFLIDWDTARVALPERDLWLLDPGGGSTFVEYGRLTGRRVSEAAVRLYRLRRNLSDVAAYVAGFRQPHDAGLDVQKSWGFLNDFLVSGLESTSERSRASDTFDAACDAFTSLCRSRHKSLGRSRRPAYVGRGRGSR